MSRARYLVQFFPVIIEEELSEIKVKKMMMSEQEQDALTMELGTTMFGENYNKHGDNAEMPSTIAGQLGSTVKEWKSTLEGEMIIKKQRPL